MRYSLLPIKVVYTKTRDFHCFGIILWLTMFLIPARVNGQSRSIDSLKSILTHNQPPSKRVQSLVELCYSFFSIGVPDSLKNYANELEELAKQDASSPAAVNAFFFQSQVFRKDSMLYNTYAIKSYSLAKQHNYKEGIALSCLGQGIHLRVLGQYGKAIELLNEGLSSLEDEHGRRANELRADLNGALSSVYHNQGKYTNALSFGLAANRIAMTLADSLRLIKSYNNLSAAYGELSSTENNLGSMEDRARYRNLSKVFTLKSFKSSLSQANKRMPAVAAYNLGLIYNEEHQPDSSNYFLFQAIRIGTSIQYNELLANAYSIMGLNFSDSQSDSALYYFEKSILHAKKSQLKALVANMYLNKASIYHRNGMLKESIELAQQSLALNLDTDELDGAMASYKLLSEVSEEQGLANQSLTYYKSYVNLKDSILNKDNFAKMEELKTRFETELKDKEIEGLSQAASIQGLRISKRNYMVAGLLGFIVLAAFGVLLFVRQQAILTKERELDLENRFLRSQLNPHFLFNALSAIQQFIYEQEDRTIAADYIGKFSSLTRRILNYTREEFISLEQEIDFLKDYLDLQKIRFEIPFDYRVIVEDELDAESVLIPPMVTQPFIENSIEHGILKKKEKGEIEIIFRNRNDQLEIVIQDNGIGREQAAFNKRNEKHRSLATQVTRERLASLHYKKKRKAELNIYDRKDATGNIIGTQVTFSLPLMVE
jgi:hypothetical protein